MITIKNVVIEKQDVKLLDFDVEKDYMVFFDFNPSLPIALAQIKLSNGKLIANLNMFLADFKGLYPAIKYSVNEDSGRYDLISIGLCRNKNLDETIKPLA